MIKLEQKQEKFKEPLENLDTQFPEISKGHVNNPKKSLDKWHSNGLKKQQELWLMT